MTITRKQPSFRAAFIDLDDTLYQVPAVSRLVTQFIQEYMKDTLNMDEEHVNALAASSYMKFGTTLAGLMAEGVSIDVNDWHAYVHGRIDYSLIQADPAMRETVCALEMPRFVFTNADRVHAERCLDRLGLSDCFQDIICFESIQAMRACHDQKSDDIVVCKPNPLAFVLALKQAGLDRAEEVIFLDDSQRNVRTAKEMGFFTVLVGHDIPDAAHMCVPTLVDLHANYAQLFDNPMVVPWKPLPCPA